MTAQAAFEICIQLRKLLKFIIFMTIIPLKHDLVRRGPPGNSAQARPPAPPIEGDGRGDELDMKVRPKPGQKVGGQRVPAFWIVLRKHYYRDNNEVVEFSALEQGCNRFRPRKPTE